MGAQASNNFSEDLVNGSNPRYTYSQPSIAEQVAQQVKKIYSKYFLSDEESWELKLEKLKKYIDENAKSTI